MRRVEAAITYSKTDITSSVRNDLLGFSYSEVAEGSADTLSITFQNRDDKWFNGWFPTNGDEVIFSITSYDWNSPGEVLTLSCGAMQIDEPEFSLVPSTFKLNALNIPAAAGFSDVAESKEWASVTLKALGQEIADKYGLQFSYESGVSVVMQKLKRSNQTDSDFLKGTAEKFGLCLKIFSNKLVLYSKYLLEQQDPVITITKGKTSVIDGILRVPTVGTGYSAVEVTSSDSNSPGSYTYRIAEGGKTLKASQSFDNLAQAELIAKAKLREANEKQFTGEFTLPLNLTITAACTIMLSGYGRFDGKYFVDKAEHSGGDTTGKTAITIHKCLEGNY